MKYYRLSQSNDYSSLMPENEEEYYLHRNLPDIKNYKPMKVSRYNNPKPKKIGGDMIGYNPIIVSQNFVNKMGDRLLEYGMFYPLEAPNETQMYWIFKVENEIDALDFENSTGSADRWYPDKSNVKYTALTSFFLKKELIENDRSYIFQVPQYGDSYTFVNEIFVKDVETNGLTGAAFYEEGVDWLKGKPVIVNKNLK